MDRAVPLEYDRGKDEDSNDMFFKIIRSSLHAKMTKFFVHHLFCLFSAGAFALRTFSCWTFALRTVYIKRTGVEFHFLPLNARPFG